MSSAAIRAATASKIYSGFDPRCIPNCQLWLDGADGNTLYSDSAGTTLATVGNTIGFWKDKSGAGRNYTQATAGYRPSYASTGSISFTGSAVLINSATWTTGVAYDIFVVGTPLTTASGTYRTLLRGLNTDHPILIQTGTTALGFWSNAVSTFYQFGSLTLNGSARALIYVSISASRTYSAALNGTLATSAASGSGTADSNMFYYVGSAGQPGGQPWGTINEILIYQRTSSYSERKQIEGYLAWKWAGTSAALITALPTGHTYKNIGVVSRPWQPTDISGCILWLNGQDISSKSMTFSGSSISTWKDQSGYGNDFTSGLSPVMGTANSRPIVDTTGGGYFQNLSFSVPLTYSAFVVGYSTITNTWTGLLYATPDAIFMLRGYLNQMLVFKGNGSSWGTNSGTYPAITSNSVWSVINTTTSGAINLYKDGTYQGNNSGATNIASTGLYIGLWVNTSYPWKGYIGDVIFYNRGLSAAEQARVEGYLAWKYNLQGSLGSTHPFKLYPTLAPVPSFLPTFFRNLSLWLDAADSTVFSGGATWTDKSGNSNNATNGTPGTTAMPSTTTWANGLTAARFLIANKNSCKTTNVIPAFSVTYFFVLRITALAAAISQQFIFINNVDGQRQMDTPSNAFPASIRYTTNSPSGSPTITTTTQNTGVIICLTVPSGTSGTSYAYANGSISPSISQTPLYTPATSNSINYFGSANGASNYISADYGEIIIYSSILTTSQRQAVEGYLAWKWGLQSNLPTAHPYYKSIP